MKHIKLFEGFVNENARKEAEKIADQITDGIQDMINNDEEIDGAYYLVKDYFEGDTRNPLFNMVVDLVGKWMKKNRVNEGVSREAVMIHGITGSGQDAVQNFIDDNDIDAEALMRYVIQHKNSKEKYDVRDMIKGIGVGALPLHRKQFFKKFKK